MEDGREGESGDKLDSSARAVPGDNGKPAGTEEKNVLDTADIIKHVSTVSSVCTGFDLL